MKPELRRITAALQQAANQYASLNDASGRAIPAPPSISSTAVGSDGSRNDALSGTGLNLPTMSKELFENALHARLTRPESDRSLDSPEFASDQESRRFVALTNSALSVNLLQDFQSMVGEWIAALEEVLRSIQDLYEEGPIIEGWLESDSSGNSLKTPVAQSVKDESPQLPFTNSQTSSYKQEQSVAANSAYRLYSFTEDGQVLCRDCPPDQLPDVGLAIVRYQRLQALIARKRSLETRLNVLTELLVEVHGKILDL